MSDIYSILNINSGIIKDFHLLADRVADHQIEKVINKNMRTLKQIEERMFVDKGLNVTQQSIDEIISKVIRIASSGDTSMDNWTIRELRIVSYYLMKLRDDNACYLYALDLLDKNWKNMLFNGLAFYLLNSWHSIEPDYRELTSQLLIRKLNAYTESNRRYSLWKNRANLFDSNGPVRMAALLKAKNMSIADAPSLLGFKNTSIKQAYYSDVIVKYVESNHITDRDSIEQVFELHNLDRTKKLIFAYLVETEDKIGDEVRRSQLCRFANSQLGDVTLVSSWAPFSGASEIEVLRLKKAMNLVNMWFLQQIVESFFEICVQDRERKSFWLKYVQNGKVRGFKIIGSTAVKRLLQSNSKIGNMFLRHFIETNSYSSQTSALVLFIKNKMFVEFSDTGALYVYNQTHSMVKKVTNARYGISSTNELKIPSMNVLIEANTWGGYYYYEEGRMTHQGYWQQRLEGWLNKMVLSSDNNNVSFLDQKHDDIFKAKPLPAENFKPQTVSCVETDSVKQEERTAEQKSDYLALEPEASEFKYKIASKVLENGVRVVANTKGFYLSLGKKHYELIKLFSPEQLPTGNIWIKKASLVGWNEILHNYYGTDTRSIGFIRITTDEVTFKDALFVADKTKYKLY
ncbi:EH signature domain-containing protein [Bacteroides congonensis]|uniref:EH signature domain-containing protein n=1 Tax=Bacteroides congonensis TaxID=1871006 RepID=UPI0018A02E7E|nr:EH signature domain-containing protein [Bacteroides congonensis]